MSFLDKVCDTIATLDRKKFNLYLGIALGGATLISGGMVYWLYAKRSAQITALTQLHEQSRKHDVIVRNSEKITAEEERIQALLDEHKGFSIKSYFEQFCREHQVVPESGWDTESRSIDGNDAFDEVILPATFKKQTTQSLVQLLSALDANPIVYIKELEIKHEAKRSISFNLTIATKKRKQFWED